MLDSQKYLLVQNYANALFSNIKKLKISKEEFLVFVSFFDKDVLKVLTSRDVEKETKISIIEAAEFRDIFLNFSKYLFLNNRFNLFVEISNRILDLFDEADNITKMYVTSVNKLTEEEIEKLKLIVDNKFNNNFRIINNVDNSILGGIVVRYKSYVFDLSIKGRLSNFESSFYKKLFN